MSEEQGGGILSHLTTQQKLIAGGLVLAVGLGVLAARKKSSTSGATSSLADYTDTSSTGATSQSAEQPSVLPSWWADYIAAQTAAQTAATTPTPSITPAASSQPAATAPASPVAAPVIAPAAAPIQPVVVKPVEVKVVAPVAAEPYKPAASTPKIEVAKAYAIPDAKPVTIPTASTPVTPVVMPAIKTGPTTTLGVDQSGQVHVITGSNTVGNGNAKTNGQVADALFTAIRNEYGSGATSKVEASVYTPVVSRPATVAAPAPKHQPVTSKPAIVSASRSVQPTHPLAAAVIKKTVQPVKTVTTSKPSASAWRSAFASAFANYK